MISARWDDRGYGEQVWEYTGDLLARFNRAWPALERSAARVGTFGRDYVWGEIASGRSRLWARGDSAVVTSIQTAPNGDRALFGWLAGGCLSELHRMLRRVEVHAVAMGCVKIRMVGRLGWARRMPGFETESITLSRDI